MGKVGTLLYTLLAAIPVALAVKFILTVLFAATNLLIGVPRLPIYLPSLVDWLLPGDRIAANDGVDYAAGSDAGSRVVTLQEQ